MGLVDVMKASAIVVVSIAIAMGAIAVRAPELFLYLPMGFIPYSMVGGNSGIVPPMFDIEPWTGDNAREWLKDGDIVVATGTKAGTTWLCYCMDAVRRKGRDDVGLPYTDIMLSTPWMELHQTPGQKWAARKHLYNSTILADGSHLKSYWDNPAFPFRVFKSHFTPKGTEDATAVLPVKEMPQVKFLVAVRHPVEVAKSLYTFFPKHTEEFRAMWGGFPPAFPDVEATIKELMPGGTLYGLYFGFVKSWWPYVSEPNVLALHYSDMVKDHEGLVDKLTRFAGVALSAEEKAKVMDQCSFGHMKKNNHLFDIKLPLNTRGVRSIMKPSTFVNKGKTGGAEEGLNSETLRAFNAAIDAEFTDPALKKWALEGGEV